jgi:tetratricopeptide (TPR) repeat protein
VGRAAADAAHLQRGAAARCAQLCARPFKPQPSECRLNTPCLWGGWQAAESGTACQHRQNHPCRGRRARGAPARHQNQTSAVRAARRPRRPRPSSRAPRPPGFCQKLLDRATLLDRRLDAARIGTQFGALLAEAGACRRAEPLLRNALELLWRELKEPHPYTARCYVALGSLLARAGKLQDAATQLQQAIDMQQARPGPLERSERCFARRAPRRGRSCCVSATHASVQHGGHVKPSGLLAGPTHRQAPMPTHSAPPSCQTSQMLGGLPASRSGSLVGSSDFNAVADAAATGAAAAQLQLVPRSASYGPLPAPAASKLLPLLLQLAEVRRRQRRFGDAEALLRRGLGVAGVAYPPNHPEVAAVKNALAQVFRLSGALPEAAALHQEALAILENALGPEHMKARPPRARTRLLGGLGCDNNHSTTDLF